MVGCCKCVSHLLFPINLSRQDLCLGCLLLEPETTNPALCQIFIPLSSILLFCLSPSMYFIAPTSPHSPHVITIIFHLNPLPFFLFISSLSLVPPLLLACLSLSLCLISSVLSNGSLGSFPYITTLFLLPPLSIQTL